MTAGGQQKYLVLTCDSEALPGAAPDNHVDRLIWGRGLGAPQDAGIGLMMDIADEFGVKVTFFHDVLEKLKYGDEIDRAARTIIERGHDLQLHLHIEFLPAEFWRKMGWCKVTWAMNLFDEESACRLLEYGIELFEGMAGFRPAAYRAGAFRYNANILKALGEFDIPMSFQYYPYTALKTSFPHGFDAGPLPVFRWENGVIEVPVSVYEHPHPRGNLARYKGFEFHGLTGLTHCLKMMDSYWENGPEFNVMVMVLHSWAFLRKNESMHYVWKDDTQVRLFRDILASLPSDVRVVSASELLREIQVNEITPAFEMPLCVAGTESIPLFPINPPESAAAVQPVSERDGMVPDGPAPTPAAAQPLAVPANGAAPAPKSGLGGMIKGFFRKAMRGAGDERDS